LEAGLSLPLLCHYSVRLDFCGEGCFRWAVFGQFGEGSPDQIAFFFFFSCTFIVPRVFPSFSNKNLGRLVGSFPAGGRY